MLTIHLACPPRESRRRLPKNRLGALVLDYAVQRGAITDGEVAELAKFSRQHGGILIQTPHTSSVF